MVDEEAGTKGTRSHPRMELASIGSLDRHIVFCPVIRVRDYTKKKGMHLLKDASVESWLLGPRLWHVEERRGGVEHAKSLSGPS